MSDPTAFGAMILAACEAQGIASLRELARRMDRPHVHLCNVVSGQREPTLDYLHEVCNALRIDCGERDPWIAAAGLERDLRRHAGDLVAADDFDGARVALDALARLRDLRADLRAEVIDLDAVRAARRG